MKLNVLKNRLYKGHGKGISVYLVAVFVPVEQGEVGGIILSGINSCCRKLVAYAFNGILIWHQGLNFAFLICPIFDVMLVSALVMKPGKAYTLLAAAYAYRRTVSLIVFYALKKFGRRKF